MPSVSRSDSWAERRVFAVANSAECEPYWRALARQKAKRLVAVRVSITIYLKILAYIGWHGVDTDIDTTIIWIN